MILAVRDLIPLRKTTKGNINYGITSNGNSRAVSVNVI